jgi:dipeptidase
MCDTFVIPPSLSASGHWIFAKNSDREPNEAQQWMYIPAGTRDRDQVHTSFIDVDHPRDYHGMWLSRPFHLWGGEMGVNDHGLAIGNEAVFTRIPIAKQNDGLTGMDMIRLALEKCRYAKQAVDQICHYVETYGQDACGGYRNRNFYYHNSFIVCDPREAYVLETAGRHWVYRRLDGFYAISNRLTIGQAWDGISDDAISDARSRNWCRGTEDFDFAAAYTAPLMSRLAMARQRRESCMTQSTVRSAGSKLTIGDAIAILRSHAGGNDFEPRRGAMNSVCLHATGLLTPSQTTGSLVAELRPGTHATIWATGSASPCLGMFKPFFSAVPAAHESFILSPGAKPGNAYWWLWERWHRQALRKYREAKQAWVNIALPAETAWLKTWEGKSPGETLPIELGKISDDAIENSLRILADMAEALSHQQPDPRGLLYRYAWRQWNKAAGISPG